jgi:hypothetical protein
MKPQRYQLQLSFEAPSTASLDSSQPKNILAKNIRAKNIQTNARVCGFVNTLQPHRSWYSFRTHAGTTWGGAGRKSWEKKRKRKEKEKEEKKAHGT